MDYESLLKVQDDLLSRLDLLDCINDTNDGRRQPIASLQLSSSPALTIEDHHSTINELRFSDSSFNKDNDDQILQAWQVSSIIQQQSCNAQTQKQQQVRNHQNKSKFRITIRPQTQDTKNLIQFFRSPIQKFLKRQFPKQNLANEQAYRSFDNSVSQDKLIQLFLVPRFRHSFRRYFAKNQIYRDLLKAGTGLGNKKNFAKKLSFFKDTFEKVTINTIQVHQM